MEKEQIFDFCVPQAQYLADLVGIRSDLFMVKELTKRFLTLASQKPPSDHLYKNAFCIAAVITYGRATGSGVRNANTQSMINLLEPELVNAHEYFKAIRDKWAAHSVNNFEQSRVTIQIRVDDSGQPIPTLISEGHKNTTALSGRDMMRLSQLADGLLAALKREIELEKVELIAYAKTVNLACLLANPQAFSRPNDPERHDKRRKSF